MVQVDFVWNDGGRAASGFVGFAGDCVTRAIAIATGEAYRDVYRSIGEASLRTPRNGVPIDIARSYLAKRGWSHHDGNFPIQLTSSLPNGPVIAYVAQDSEKHHLTAFIDRLIHDTWNPADENYEILEYWTPPAEQFNDRSTALRAAFQRSEKQVVTQEAFEKILARLRALDRTAKNDASTEGEKHNALRMMQDLMLRHNLTREDIVDDDNVDNVLFTRMACPLNGRRCCTWEAGLAFYLTRHIFPTVQYYIGKLAHRSLVWFYGPKDDVVNIIELYKELLLTIATSAYMNFGGYAKGSGASYAEGYVAGLPRWHSTPSEVRSPTGTPPSSNDQASSPEAMQDGGLILQRALAVQDAAKTWLNFECGIRLRNVRSYGRYAHDPNAESQGRIDGASHNITAGRRPLRITDGR